MKRIINFSFVNLFPLPGKKAIWFICGSCIVFFSSCFQHYYKTNSSDQINATTLQTQVNADKYFVLHAKNTAFAFTHVKVNDNSLEGDLDELSNGHSLYLNPAGPDHNRFLVKNKDTVLYEVHLYASLSNASFTHVAIPFKDFTRMDIYSLDKLHTTRSTISSIAGTVLITAGVITLICGIAAVNSINY